MEIVIGANKYTELQFKQIELCKWRIGRLRELEENLFKEMVDDIQVNPNDHDLKQYIGIRSNDTER